MFRILTDIEVRAIGPAGQVDLMAEVLTVPFQWYLVSFYRKSPDDYPTKYSCIQKLSWIMPNGESVDIGKPISFEFANRGHNVHAAMHGLPLTKGRRLYHIQANLFVDGSSEPMLSRRIPIVVDLVIEVATESNEAQSQNDE